MNLDTVPPAQGRQLRGRREESRTQAGDNVGIMGMRWNNPDYLSELVPCRATFALPYNGT